MTATPRRRRITDEGVRRLPLSEGRAALLEEIMSQPTALAPDPTPDTDPASAGRRRWTRWALPVAAAAAVAAVVVVPQTLGDDEAPEQPPAAAAPGSGEIAVLDLPGWELESASVDEEYGGELDYENGAQTLEIHWRPAASYGDYVVDRDDIGPREQVEVLGEPALLWSYSGTDHTTIRDVVGDFTLEVRGQGMREPAYLALLDELTAIDPADLDEHLPEEYVTAAERPGAIAAILADIPVPDGFDSDIATEEISRYQLIADVTGAVTCAWLDQWRDGRKLSSTTAVADEAVEAMATSRDWDALQEIAQEGGWSSGIWQLADGMTAGELPEGDLMGCA